MCLTGTPAVQTGFGRGVAESPATGLGGLERRAGREDATAAAARAGSLLRGEPSAPETAPGSRGSAGPRAPAPPHPRPAIPFPQPPVSLSRHPAASALQCPAVPAPPPPARPPASTAGRFPKTSAPRQALLPRCPRMHTHRGSHTHTHCSHTHTRTPAHPSRGSEPAAARTAPGWQPLPPSRRRAGVPGPGAARPRPAAGAEGAPEEGDAPRGAAVLAARPHPQAGRAARTGSRGQPRLPGATCLPCLSHG